ncbi:hypothetical protein BC827DRAFT_1155001 [Russula dissimulans]|nr:hypothetical protein BC827DRAFT_1155001 [Russula dissimulans]
MSLSTTPSLHLSSPYENSPFCDCVHFLEAQMVYVYWKQQGFTRDASGKSSLIENLLQDGSFYFRCIFSVNLMWLIVIWFSHEDLPPGRSSQALGHNDMAVHFQKDFGQSKNSNIEDMEIHR